MHDRLTPEPVENPDAYHNPVPHQVPRDGFAAGIFVMVALGRVLGTGEKPF